MTEKPCCPSRAQPTRLAAPALVVRRAVPADERKLGWVRKIDPDAVDSILPGVSGACRDFVVFVAELGGRIVGAGSLWRVGVNDAYLRRVTVHPDHAHRGIGRMLVEARLRHAFNEWGAKRVSVIFLDKARGKPAYRKIGFRKPGESDGDDVMASDLVIDSSTFARNFQRGSRLRVV